jgi:hypothetical protein
MDNTRELYKFVNDYAVLTSTAQDLTNAMVDLGSRIDCRNSNQLTLILQVDINDTNNPRIQVIPALTDAATYEGVDAATPVLDETHTAGKVEATQRLVEITTDADGYYYITFDIPVGLYWQVQVMAGTVGATAGQIDSSYYIKAYV